jgi:phosphoserine phosphatase RsbU/P
VTLFFGRIDPRERRFCYANAGHPAGYILGADGQIKTLLKRTGVPLGMNPDVQYKDGACVPLAVGDVILLLTDGIEETMGPDDTFFGIDRTLEVVRAHRERSAREILDGLYRAVRDFSHDRAQLDDVTAIVIKVL